MHQAETQPLQYPIQQVDKIQIITYCIDPYNYPNVWKIYLPVALVDGVIQCSWT